MYKHRVREHMELCKEVTVKNTKVQNTKRESNYKILEEGPKIAHYIHSSIKQKTKSEKPRVQIIKRERNSSQPLCSSLLPREEGSTSPSITVIPAPEPSG